MNILYLAHRISYPPNKGEKIRAFHAIKHLYQENNLFLAFLEAEGGAGDAGATGVSAPNNHRSVM